MTAVRLGSIPGKHLVMFDSPYDTISICHEARNREGFAKGALEGAEWLRDKHGFFTLDDFFKGVCNVP
jgi:4-hydroxy-tetrahydrodipicolinate reductase